MSVNWWATIGFGVQYDVRPTMDEMSKAGVYDEFYEFLDDLASNLEDKYPLLTYAVSGDCFYGAAEATKDYVLLKKTVVQLRDWVKPFDLDKLQDGEADEESLAELLRFSEDTGSTFGEVGWKLILTRG